MRLIIADEPGAWSPIQGRRLWDAMLTSLGKRKTQIIVVGTLAPAPLTGPASWWPSFVAEGSGDGRHVALLQADPAKWTDFDEVLRVNPVCAVNPYLRETLELEHAAALKSERSARTFRAIPFATLPGEAIESQPSNHGGGMGAESVLARSRRAKRSPLSAWTLGGNRSWSAAAALWPNGRIEAWALAPGLTVTGLSGARRPCCRRRLCRTRSGGRS